MKNKNKFLYINNIIFLIILFFSYLFNIPLQKSCLPNSVIPNKSDICSVDSEKKECNFDHCDNICKCNKYNNSNELLRYKNNDWIKPQISYLTINNKIIFCNYFKYNKIEHVSFDIFRPPKNSLI